MPSELLDWNRAFQAGPTRCGGKGYNLARLARYGFNVPAGGVLTVEAYADVMTLPVLARLADELGGISAEQTLSAPVVTKLQKLRGAIEDARLPIAVQDELARFLPKRGLADIPLAVRSSAVGEDSAGASFAGIHRSFLNVLGPEAIERVTLGCFASLWTPQALAYRRRMNLGDHEVRCAVVICAMVTRPGAEEPASAGVAFSCDPRTGRRDLIVINAARGLGEKVVSGAVDPDQIEVQISRGAICTLNRKLHGEPVLTPFQEAELARQVWRIHWALGNGDDPQDVEWAHDGERFWIVQARPVTRVPLYTLEGAKHLPVIWSTANIKEAVPGVVSLMAWSMIHEVIEGVLYAGPMSAGYILPPGLQTVRRFKGRAYFDLTTMQWCFYDSIGVLPADLVRAIGGHQPEIPVPAGSPFRGRAGRRRARNVIRLLARFLRLPRDFARASRAHFAEVRTVARLNFAALSDQQLLEVFRHLERLYQSIDRLVGIANGYPGPFQQALETQLRKVAGARTHSLMSGLLAGGGGITSAEQGYRTRDLAEAARGDAAALAWLKRHEPPETWTCLPDDSAFRGELQRFLHDFGHRAVYEADILNPRWAEDPGFVLDLVRGYLECPPQPSPQEAARQVRARAEEELRTLSFWRRPLVRWLAKRLQAALALRELGKSTLVAGVWPARLLQLELGRRLTASGRLDHPAQVFHLSKADVLLILHGEWDGRGARELGQDRERQRAQWLLEAPPPDVIIEGGVLPTSTSAPASSPTPDAQSWHGIGVSAGRAVGFGRVVRHPEEGSKLRHGEVLIAPSTDPGWTPLFLRACAIVMETGGYLSHGAIVAREYGIPAVMNIPGLLDRVHDGDRLLVDGDAGRVALEAPYEASMA